MLPYRFKVTIGSLDKVTVCKTNDEAMALSSFEDAKYYSQIGFGQLAGEDVALFDNGIVSRSHIGTLDLG